MSKKIIPFGRYKGRSLEEMQADRPYVEWLSGQDWFRERFAEIYALLAAGQVSQETPEHNALQALFLDSRYCVALADLLGPKTDNSKFDYKPPKAVFEDRGADVVFGYWGRRETTHVVKQVTSLADAEAERRRYHGSTPKSYVSFETRTTDDLSARPLCNYQGSGVYRIDIKTDLGDDYPVALRQLTASSCNVMLVARYNGTGATWEQLVQIFATKKIHCVLFAELDSVANR